MFDNMKVLMFLKSNIDFMAHVSSNEQNQLYAYILIWHTCSHARTHAHTNPTLLDICAILTIHHN